MSSEEELAAKEAVFEEMLGLSGSKELPGTYRDKDGTPISLARWMALASEPRYKRIAFTEVCEGVEVSTVWLGLDYHSDHRGSEVFETMVFVAESETLREGTECYRYRSEAQAVAGHDQVVAELRSQFTLV